MTYAQPYFGSCASACTPMMAWSLSLMGKAIKANALVPQASSPAHEGQWIGPSWLMAYPIELDSETMQAKGRPHRP